MCTFRMRAKKVSTALRHSVKPCLIKSHWARWEGGALTLHNVRPGAVLLLRHAARGPTPCAVADGRCIRPVAAAVGLLRPAACNRHRRQQAARWAHPHTTGLQQMLLLHKVPLQLHLLVRTEWLACGGVAAYAAIGGVRGGAVAVGALQAPGTAAPWRTVCATRLVRNQDANMLLLHV